MNILFLGYDDTPLVEFLKNDNDIQCVSSKLNLNDFIKYGPDIIISYGYRHIITKDIIAYYQNKIINLHISFLPWNKGCFPNIWSIIDDTPKGVTIHIMDEGIDTGHILFQKYTDINDNDTLESSYNKLKTDIENLFMEKWDNIKQLNLKGMPQLTLGSYHSYKDSLEYFKTLQIDWSMKVSELQHRTDEAIIDEVKAIRNKNNEHWMDVVKLAFKLSPVEARQIFKNIKDCDHQINVLLKELANNDDMD
jgi:methionyl-tRNA formyltransferase